MARELALGVHLKLDDALGGPSAKALANMVKQAKRSAGDITRSTRDSVTAQQREFRKLSSARETLGIRSEKTIQREIQQTEAAYRRLKDSGTLSFREQGRAAEAARRHVTQLRNEMGRLTTAQKLAGIGRGIRDVAIGGAVAAAYLRPGVDRAMAYDLRLANMSNTAFSSRDLAGRRRGMSELDQAIKKALRYGGGTRDSAAEALNSIVASGAMSPTVAQNFLPSVMRTATASDAAPNDIAQIGIRGMQTFGIKDASLQRVLDMAVSGGQAGSFELKDMAAWLPKQMAAATLSGMSGETGFAKLVAANQAAAITAGDSNEAGNNLMNLLQKINSRDAAMDAAKLGINLPAHLTRDRSKGMDSLDSFVGLVDEVVKHDAHYKKLQAKLASTTDQSEKREVYESMTQILQGSSIGKVVQDRQALSALVGIMNNRPYMKQVLAGAYAGAANGATAQNFALIGETASFKTGQLGNEKLFSEQNVMNKLTPAISSAADVLTDYAKKYPALTTAVVGATTALTALAVAAGSSMLFNGLSGGFGRGGLGRGAAGGAADALGSAKGVGSRLGGSWLGRLGLFGLGATSAIGAGAAVDSMGAEKFALPGGGAFLGANLLSQFFGGHADASAAVAQKAEQTKVGGEVRVVVDDQRTSVTAKSDNKDVPMWVYAGRAFLGAGF